MAVPMNLCSSWSVSDLRIVFVTHQFFPTYYTGVERLTLNLATQLRKMGHQCVVVTSADHADGGSDRYLYGGVIVRTVSAGETDLARPWAQDPRAGRELGRILDEERPDIVHVMHPMRLPQAFDEAERRRIPVIAHLADFGYVCARLNLLRVDGSLCPGADNGHACVSACGIESGGERVAWGRDLLRRAAAVISPSRFAIGVFEAEGFDTSDWWHVPWGVDYALHSERLPAPEGDRLVLGFLGTLIYQKGPHVLVEALRLLPGRDIELRLYGDSFHEDTYGKKLRALTAGDERIRFMGRYEHEGLRDVLAPLDAVMIPSVWYENLPTTGLNAVAAGVPLLVSDVDGLRELVHDYDCGLTFRVGDASALASALEALRHDRKLLSRMRARMTFPPTVEEEAWRIREAYDVGHAAPTSGSRRRAAGSRLPQVSDGFGRQPITETR
jgi:glycosyltransferase involved in cell wall biosynthesis